MPLQSEWMQNSNPLPRITFGKKQEDWKSQISAATSLSFERFFSSACWRNNQFCQAPADQEQLKQLAHTRRAPLPLHPKIWNSYHWPWRCLTSTGATMKPSLTTIFSCATAQYNLIPTNAQITHDLTCTGCPYKTPRSIDGTWRDAIDGSHRLREHCQAGTREETPPCEVRAPIKILHTEQDTMHFFFLNGDTIKVDIKPHATSCRTTDHKRC